MINFGSYSYQWLFTVASKSSRVSCIRLMELSS